MVSRVSNSLTRETRACPGWLYNAACPELLRSVAFLSRYMKFRQTILPALLALMLLFAQQFGHVHALSHLADGGDKPSHSKQLPADKACDLCLAFSAVGAALTASPTLPPVQAGSYPLPDTSRPQFPALAFAAAFHSRAPPVTL